MCFPLADRTFKKSVLLLVFVYSVMTRALHLELCCKTNKLLIRLAGKTFQNLTFRLQIQYVFSSVDRFLTKLKPPSDKRVLPRCPLTNCTSDGLKLTWAADFSLESMKVNTKIFLIWIFQCYLVGLTVCFLDEDGCSSNKMWYSTVKSLKFD